MKKIKNICCWLWMKVVLSTKKMNFQNISDIYVLKAIYPRFFLLSELAHKQICAIKCQIINSG